VNCNDTSTGLELYQKATNSDSTKSAWHSFVKFAGEKRLQELQHSALVEDCLARYARQDKLLTLIHAALRHVKTAPPATCAILEKLDLWDSAYGVLGNIPKIVGALNYHNGHRLAELIQKSKYGLKKALTGALLFPFEATPGQVVSFVIVDANLEFLNYCVSATAPEEGGILGLGDVLKNNNTIIAVHDVVTWCRFHGNWNRLHSTPLNIVCVPSRSRAYFQYSASFAFNALENRKVIFYDSYPSADCVNNARKLKENGYTACDPPDLDIANVNIPQAVAAIQSSATHWSVYLAKWLEKSDSHEVSLILKSLQPELTFDELSQVLEHLPPQKREAFRAMVPGTSVLRYFKFGQETYYESPGSGLFVSQGANGKLVSDAILDFQGVNTSGPVEVVTGSILYGALQLPFTCPLSEIQENPANWLRRALLPSGVVPSLNSAYRDSYVDICLARSKPKEIKVFQFSGWQDDRWIFPNVTVSADGVLSEKNIFAEKNPPGQNLICTATAAPGERMNAWSNAAPSLIPLLAFFLLNAQRQKDGKPLLNCLINSNSHVFDMVAAQIGLRGALDVATAQRVEIKGCLPVRVVREFGNVDQLNKQIEGGCSGLVLSAPAGYVTAALPHKNWVLLHLPDLPADSLIGFDQCYLHLLARNNSTNNTIEKTVHWLVDEYKLNSGGSFLDLSTLNGLQRLLVAVIFGIQSQLISFGTKSKTSVVTQSHDKVILRWKKIYSALQDHKIYLPDVTEVDSCNGLLRIDDGWAVSRADFDKITEMWNSYYHHNN